MLFLPPLGDAVSVWKNQSFWPLSLQDLLLAQSAGLTGLGWDGLGWLLVAAAGLLSSIRVVVVVAVVEVMVQVVMLVVRLAKTGVSYLGTKVGVRSR